MKYIYIFVFVALFLVNEVSAFTSGMTLERKSVESGLIIQGKVVSVIDLSVQGVVLETKESMKSEVLSKEFSGPTAVALVYVEKVVKGDLKFLGTVVYVPCGYSFDESPSELTKSVRYVLFLEAMGRNFFHPLGPYCIHRIFEEKVGLSGFDWKGDFDADAKNGASMSLE